MLGLRIVRPAGKHEQKAVRFHPALGLPGNRLPVPLPFGDTEAQQPLPRPRPVFRLLHLHFLLWPTPVRHKPPNRLRHGSACASSSRRLHSVDPSAILVTPRLLRRVIKQSALLPGFGWRVPHRKSYVLSQSELLSIVDRDELDLPAGVALAETVILLARPAADRLEANSAVDNLTICWRLLFHARRASALDARVVQGHLGPEEVLDRRARIGATEFDEIHTVLKQENFLLPPESDLATYLEFAAVFLELHYFAPGS